MVEIDLVVTQKVEVGNAGGGLAIAASGRATTP